MTLRTTANYVLHATKMPGDNGRGGDRTRAGVPLDNQEHSRCSGGLDGSRLERKGTSGGHGGNTTLNRVKDSFAGS